MSERTGAAVNETPTDDPAISAGAEKEGAFAAVSGLKRSTARVTEGATSLSSSTHFPPKDG